MQDFEIENGELRRYHGNGGDVVIPESVTSIGDCAFTACKNLTDITLPEGLVSIGKRVFSYCTCLTGISIPEGVRFISKFAFSYCKSLTNIRIPENMEDIGIHAFWNCTKLNLFYHGYQFSPDTACKIESKVFKMVKEKDFSVNVPMSDKAPVIFDMYLSVPQDREITAYIKKHFIEMFQILINMHDTNKARKIMESGQFITKENIDTLIQCAIEKKAYDIQLMLTDYKHEKIGYADEESDIRKRFEL